MTSKDSTPYIGVDRSDLDETATQTDAIQINEIVALLMRFPPDKALDLFDSLDKVLKPNAVWRRHDEEIQDMLLKRQNSAPPSVTINYPNVYGTMFDVNHNDNVKLGGQSYG